MTYRSSLSWALVGQVSVALINFAGMLVIARLLEPAEMGIYAVALATTVLLGTVSTIGASAYVVREIDLPPRKIDTAFTVNALLNLGLAAALLLVAPAVARFVIEPRVEDILHLLALRPVIAIFEFRPAALLQREGNFRTPAQVAIIAALINTGITVTAARLGESYYSLAYGTLAAGACNALLLTALAPTYASLRLSLAFWRPLLEFGLRMITISGTALLAQRVSEIIMGRLLGMPAVGFFTRATQISDLLFSNIYGAFTRVIFSRMADEQRMGRGLTGSFLWGVEIITTVMWPVLLSVALLSPALINILYGEKWASAAAPLSLLMVAQFIATLFAMNWELFVIRNETSRQTGFEIIRAVSSVCAFTAGCLVSMGAAAAGRIVDCMVGFSLYRRHINRLAEVPSGSLQSIYRRSGLLMLIANLPALALMTWTGWSPSTNPLAVLISILAGAVAWLVTISRVRHPVWELIRNR